MNIQSLDKLLATDTMKRRAKESISVLCCYVTLLGKNPSLKNQNET